MSGHVTGLVTSVADVGREFVDCAADEVSWVSGSGPGRKRIRLNRKTPAPRGFYGSISSTYLEEVASCGVYQCFYP